MLLTPLILNQHLALPPKPSRTLPRHPHHIPHTPRLSKDAIHLLQTPQRRLRIKQIHDGQDEGVDGRENEVRFPADGREADRRDHDDEEIEGPVGGCAEGVGGRADPQGHDFGGIQPGHAEPADGEEGVVDEEEEGGDDARGFTADFGHDGEDYHAEDHAGAAEHHELAAAETLDCEDLVLRSCC